MTDCFVLFQKIALLVRIFVCKAYTKHEPFIFLYSYCAVSVSIASLASLFPGESYRIPLL